MFFILFYDYVPDILERRAPIRSEHLSHAGAWHADGRLVMAGAFVEPVDGAAFIFRVESRADVEAFVTNDPYVQSGLVTGHRVREWNVVIGAS